MPTLDEFKEKQEKMESKRQQLGFKPKRYAPYLLQEEVIKFSEENRNIINFNSLENYNEKQSEVLQKNDFTEESILCLYGIKKKIIFYFLELCEKRNDLTTGPITSDILVKVSGSTYKTVKKILQNMIEDGLISRRSGKRGRGGFSIFSLSIELKQKMIKYKQMIQCIKSDFDSNYSNKENINKTLVNNPDSFLNSINIEPLSKIGLTKQHLYQLSNHQKLSPEMIQDSINHFSFDLIKNDKAKTLKKTPLEFFMGILRHGHPYAAPANYEAPEAESLRLYLESKQRVLRLTEELENRAKADLFQEWHQSLSPQEIEAFWVEDERLANIPENMRETLKRNNTLNRARQHFEATIWPEKRKRILEENKHPSPLAEGVSE